MTRSSRIRIQGAGVALLGALVLRPAPEANAVSVSACWESCLDGVWNTHCPDGYYADCNYTACTIPYVLVYCRILE